MQKTGKKSQHYYMNLPIFLLIHTLFNTLTPTFKDESTIKSNKDIVIIITIIIVLKMIIVIHILSYNIRD